MTQISTSSSNIKISEGSLLLDYDEVMPVIKEHHDKYQPSSNLPPFKLDVSSILELEARRLFFSSKLEIDGKIQGFIGSAICPNLHYKGKQFSHTNVIYLNPKLDKKIDKLKRLLKHHEDLAKEYGMDYIEVGASPIKDISKLLEKLGYFKIEVTLTKPL